jgi:hypothetical protein
MMRRLHALLGIVGVIAFLATGIYMRRYPAGMQSLDGGTRMVFRSRHIYLLLASLLNLAFGIYLRPASSLARRSAQVFGSMLILTAPAFLLAAFFQEPHRPEPGGPFAFTAVIGLFVGTICHTLAGEPVEVPRP